MRTRLIKTTIERLAPPDKGELLAWDDSLPGFGVRVTPGGVRSYIVQRRVNGKQRRITIGRHGVFTPDEARKAARVELGKMAGGSDPILERAKNRALATTLRELFELYLTERRDLKPRTVADYRHHLKTNFSGWADKPASGITRDKVARRFLELSKRSPAQANQAFRSLRAVWNYARARYRADDGEAVLPENPVHVLSEGKLWHRTRAKTNYVPLDRIGQWYALLQDIRDDPGLAPHTKTGADILAFLVLTGLRWGEAAGLTWERIDLDAGEIRLEDTKNRSSVTLPLSDAAQRILAERPEGSPYAFPNRTGAYKPLKNARGTLIKMHEGSGFRVTPHDLRRTFRALAGQCGIELWKAKLLMNHKLSGDVTIAHYTDTENLQYLRPEVDAIAALVEEKAAAARSERWWRSARVKRKTGQ